MAWSGLAQEAAGGTAGIAVEGDGPLPVISCDGHVGPSVRHQLRPYCEAKYLDVFDEYTDDLYNSRPSDFVSNELDIPPEVVEYRMRPGALDGLSDPVARLRDMDSNGVAAEILYHGGGNGETVPFNMFGITVTWSSRKYDYLESVGVDIYNRWLADYVSTDPNRLLGLAHITAHDVEEAVRQLKWAHAAGLRGVNLPAPRRDVVPYTDSSWDPLWALCEDLGMALNTHAGLGDIDDRITGQAQNPVYLMEVSWFGRRAIWQLIFAGVFERFPGLKYVVAEQFSDWVPSTLREMDSVYASPYFSRTLRKALPRRPSEYFLTNCFCGGSFLSREEAQIAVDENFSSNVMWGSDYPHPEGSQPYTLLALRKTFAGLPAEDVRNFIYGAAVDAYGLDLTSVADVAAKVGPAMSDIMEPYDGHPDDRGISLAFREFGHWA